MVLIEQFLTIGAFPHVANSAANGSTVLSQVLNAGNIEGQSGKVWSIDNEKGVGPLRVSVATYRLDDVDKQLLNLLQENARYTAIELAEAIGVSDNTVHNRMKQLEEENVITGYTTTTDYDRTGLRLYFHFSCTARISERSVVAEQAMAMPQIIEVTELMTGHENLHLKAVGAEDEDITAIAEQLDNLPLEINDENLIRAEHTQPLDYVAVSEIVSDE